ncbi:MAG: archease [Candidatus Thermoplasmatota archaeon]|nr:archease [Candidatus Thermoplasmatota archaeon]MCL5731550.1 archease [Candidatus Thermoplasmatota archaeon]
MPLEDCHSEFEVLESTADVSFRVAGETREDLLSRSLRALACIIDGNGRIEDQNYGYLKIYGSDFKNILIGTLNRAIMIFDTENFLIRHAEDISIDTKRVSFQAFGYSPGENVSGDIVKAATFHNLNYRENPYSIEITLDL